MVTRRQGIILDGLGAYPADGRCGIFVFVRIGIGGLGGHIGGRFRCRLVCRRRGFMAATSGGFVGPAAVTTASPSAVAPSVTVFRLGGLSFGGR